MITDRKIISQAKKYCAEYKEHEMFEGELLPAELIFYEEDLIKLVRKLIEQDKKSHYKLM